MKRVIDQTTAAVVEDMFGVVENGTTTATIARTLNAKGVRTIRGCAWYAPAVRDLVRNPVYRGEGGR
jgi:Recombinase